jgi:2-keto-4-pentenoate hydratase/2-oxohepta-3-ene-1,7-dioic acid hydratase in catechol pathway
MKIFCIGRNYSEHAAELNNDVPTTPMVFMKPSTALLIEGKPFYFPSFSKKIHYEIELVLKICKNGKNIDPEFASSYYEEIGLGIDFTARDLQQELKEQGHPWEKSKAFDNSAVLGGFKNKTEFDDINSIEFTLKLNDNTVQKGNSKDLIFDFTTLICNISEFFTLQKGDLIYTGTPAGVGPVKIGDRLQGYIYGDKLLDCEIK